MRHIITRFQLASGDVFESCMRVTKNTDGTTATLQDVLAWKFPDVPQVPASVPVVVIETFLH